MPVGQQVKPGVNIARVADPTSLKAVLRVAETQITGVRVGQPVLVDTRNGLIQGRFRASTRQHVKALSRSTFRWLAFAAERASRSQRRRNHRTRTSARRP